METHNIILIALLHGIVFGTACYFIGVQRQIGALAGAFLGAILGTIGLIIVLVSPKKEPVAFQLQKYKALFDAGVITETDYNQLKGKLIEGSKL